VGLSGMMHLSQPWEKSWEAAAAWSLIADDFHQDAFAAATVELAVKNLFPGPEIEAAPGYGHHYLPAHDLPLQMGISVILPDVVAIPGDRGVRGRVSSQAS
jgi:hypothetical protein